MVIRDNDRTTRMQGELLAPGGATGDVLTQQADGTFAPAAGGGALPDPITDPVHVAVDSDVAGLTVTGFNAGSANVAEFTPGAPFAGNALAIDSIGRLRAPIFGFIGSAALGGSFFSLPSGQTFNIGNDDTGATVINITMHLTDQKLGFFDAPPVVQPTGVPVTAAGIHAALVALGLITA